MMDWEKWEAQLQVLDKNAKALLMTPLREIAAIIDEQLQCSKSHRRPAMTENEIQYVHAYREAAKKRDLIAGAVRDLQGVCQTLGDWRSAADDMGKGGFGNAKAWEAGKLAGLAVLRGHMVEYDTARKALAGLWKALAESREDQSGLAAPDTLDKD